MTLGVAGHIAVGPADVGRTVSVDVSDWIRTNGLTVLLASTSPFTAALHIVHQRQQSRPGPAGCIAAQQFAASAIAVDAMPSLRGMKSLMRLMFASSTL